MKITLFVGELFSSSTTFIIRKVKALAERGESVTVITSGRLQNKAHEEILAGVKNIHVISIPADKGTPLHRFFVGVWLLIKALLKSPKDTYQFGRIALQYDAWAPRLKSMRKLLGLAGLRSDVYHFEFGDIAVQHLDYLKFKARPCIVSFRGADIDIYPLVHEELKLSYRQVIEHADRIHCVSQATAHQVAQLGDPRKIFINRPSIYASFFRPTSFSKKYPAIIVSVARLKWKKGLTYALLAVAQLVTEFPDLRYIIIGEGPSKDELMFYAADLGIQNHVEFFGRASEESVKETLDRASVFLLASLEEGISNAVLEAMAMEVPVVTTDAGGMAEAVTDGVEGFVVPRYDPGALAARTRQLLQDDDLRKRMGQNARQRVLRDFTIERQVQMFLDEYYALNKPEKS
ncbi:MAG: glycosyltransferase family 4 protein [Anaerolineales bacterium]|nr:glycosyltransferase family 4 protein [Anaerolineales bacterium]